MASVCGRPNALGFNTLCSRGSILVGRFFSSVRLRRARPPRALTLLCAAGRPHRATSFWRQCPRSSTGNPRLWGSGGRHTAIPMAFGEARRVDRHGDRTNGRNRDRALASAASVMGTCNAGGPCDKQIDRVCGDLRYRVPGEQRAPGPAHGLSGVQPKALGGRPGRGLTASTLRPRRSSVLTNEGATGKLVLGGGMAPGDAECGCRRPVHRAR